MGVATRPQPAEPAKPAQPAEPAKPAEPAEPAKPAEADARAVVYWSRNGHADAAVTHAASRLGLLRVVGDAAGIDLPALAARTGVRPYAARVLCQVLRAGGVLAADRGGLVLRVGPATLDALDAATEVAGRDWAALGSAITDLTGADRDRVTGLFAEVGPEPVPCRGACWLLDRARHGHVRSRLVNAAASSGLLEALAAGPVRPAGMADRGLPATLLEALLGALRRLGICRLDGDRYQLREPVRGALADRRGCQTFALGADLAHRFWAALGHLDRTARTGVLAFDLQDERGATDYYFQLARYNSRVFSGYFGLARRVANAVGPLLATEVRHVVDVGAGSGVWGAALATAWPASTVEFCDRPRVLDQARANAQRLNLDSRARFRAVELTRDPLGNGDADVVVLGQICHTQPPHTLPDLLARCRAALRPGGLFVMAEQVLHPTGLEPADYLTFAVKELVSTGGAILDVDEYRDLLHAAGFRACHCYRGPGLDVYLAGADHVRLPEDLSPELPGIPSARPGETS